MSDWQYHLQKSLASQARRKQLESAQAKPSYKSLTIWLIRNVIDITLVKLHLYQSQPWLPRMLCQLNRPTLITLVQFNHIEFETMYGTCHMHANIALSSLYPKHYHLISTETFLNNLLLQK